MKPNQAMLCKCSAQRSSHTEDVLYTHFRPALKQFCWLFCCLVMYLCLVVGFSSCCCCCCCCWCCCCCCCCCNFPLPTSTFHQVQDLMSSVEWERLGSELRVSQLGKAEHRSKEKSKEPSVPEQGVGNHPWDLTVYLPK